MLHTLRETVVSDMYLGLGACRNAAARSNVSNPRELAMERVRVVERRGGVERGVGVEVEGEVRGVVRSDVREAPLVPLVSRPRRDGGGEDREALAGVADDGVDRGVIPARTVPAHEWPRTHE